MPASLRSTPPPEAGVGGPNTVSDRRSPLRLDHAAKRSGDLSGAVISRIENRNPDYEKLVLNLLDETNKTLFPASSTRLCETGGSSMDPPSREGYVGLPLGCKRAWHAKPLQLMLPQRSGRETEEGLFNCFVL